MDKVFLNQALELAQSRQGACAPNPAVGAVIVKHGQVVASGVHRACGEPHAEVEAIRQAGENCQGATLYVTLEPCCHWGKTPPCSEQIKQAGIARLVYGYTDPNPQVAGKGLQQCLQAGIACEHLALPQIQRFYRAYHHWTSTGTPWCIYKLASSLDGKIAAPGGKPVRLTGDKLKRLTHRYRALSDAIVTSVQTINRDDPKLNVRLDEAIAKPVFVIDTHARCLPEAQVFMCAQQVTIVHGEDAPRARLERLKAAGAQTLAMAQLNHHINLPALMRALGEAGYHQVWVEAGGRLFDGLLTTGCLQQVLLYVAPLMLGQSAYNGFHQALDFREHAHAITWHSVGDEAYCDIELGVPTCLPA